MTDIPDLSGPIPTRDEAWYRHAHAIELSDEDRALLVAVRTRLQSPSHWIKRALVGYRDPDTGRAIKVNFNDPRANCWCFVGGLCVEAELAGHSSDNVLRRVFELTGYSAGTINDRDGHKAVLALIDRMLAA